MPLGRPGRANYAVTFTTELLAAQRTSSRQRRNVAGRSAGTLGKLRANGLFRFLNWISGTAACDDDKPNSLDQPRRGRLKPPWYSARTWSPERCSTFCSPATAWACVVLEGPFVDVGVAVTRCVRQTTLPLDPLLSCSHDEPSLLHSPLERAMRSSFPNSSSRHETTATQPTTGLKCTSHPVCVAQTILQAKGVCLSCCC